MEISQKFDPSKNENSNTLSESFRRYKIRTEKVEHRYKVPHPFVPKVNKIGLAKILISEMFEYNFKLLKSKYRKTLLSRPCIYGVFSGPFGGFNPIEERCVGCMRCVEEYPDVCRVDRNPEFSKFGDSYWLSDDPSKVSNSPFSIIWFEAKTGQIQVKGMGYKGFFGLSGWDTMWTDMSEIVRPTRDGVYGREFISTRVDIGSRRDRLTFPIKSSYSNNMISIPIPIVFDYLPKNLNSKSIAKSIEGAANETNTIFIVSPDQIVTYDIDLESNYVLLVNESNIDKSMEFIEDAMAIEIDDENISLVNKIKSESDDIPIIARIRFSNNTYETITQYYKAGIDGFHLVADYHGNSFDDNQTFVRDLIQEIHTQLVEDGIRDRITIITSGGIILAEHVPKAIICGSDAIAINTASLVALQVKFDGECRYPSNSSVDETSFDPTWGKQRLVNLMGAWHNQIIEIMSAMGIKEIRRLRGDTGRAMFKEHLEEVAFGDIERID